MLWTARVSRIVAAVATAFLGLVLALGLAELVARVGSLDDFDLRISMTPGSAPRWRYDERMGWVNLPGHEPINRQGFRFPRDYARRRNRPARIAVVGDSQVYGSEVNDHGHVGVVLDRRHNGIEGYSFGVPGYGPAQELLLVGDVLRDYEVDLVILVTFLENDLIDATHLMAYGGYQKPYLAHGSNGWQVENLPVPRPLFASAKEEGAHLSYGKRREVRFLRPRRDLHDVSSLYRAVFARSTALPGLARALSLAQLAEGSLLKATAWKIWSVTRVDGKEVPCWSFADCPDEYWLDGFEATVAAYAEMKRLCARQRVAFGVLVSPSRTEHELGDPRVARTLIDALEEREIAVLDLTESFHKAGIWRIAKGFHWPPLGHRLAARASSNIGAD